MKIFIISFQSNLHLHAFFPPFLSFPYYCLCITFKSDINLQICTITHQNITAFSTFSPLIMLPLLKSCMETKKSVLCLKSMFIFRRDLQIVFTTYLEFSRIMKNVSCRTLKSYSKFLVVSLISFTDTLCNFAQTM